jgi:predicted transcriptional regulator
MPAEMQLDVGKRELCDLLLGNPVYVAQDDSTLVASATMLDHGISWLPVVRSKDDPTPVGYLRGEKITNRMMQKMEKVETDQARAAS